MVFNDVNKPFSQKEESRLVMYIGDIQVESNF